MTDYQFKQLRKGDFENAEKAKSKVDQLEKLEEEIKHVELKQNKEETMKELEDNYFYEKEKINKEFEDKIKEIETRYRVLEKQLQERYQKETDKFVDDYDKNNRKVFTKAEIVGLKKNLDICIKQKDFMKAHNIQRKLIEIENENKQKFENNQKNMSEKLKTDLKKLHKIHDEDFLVFQKKMDHELLRCKNEKDVDLNTALLKYQARIKELNLKNKKEIINLSNPATSMNKSLITLSSKYAKTTINSDVATTHRTYFK